MTSELKPCPFCGCEPIKQHNENKSRHSYECSSEESKKLCCMIMPMTHIYDSEKEAAHAWNTRAVPDVPELVRYVLHDRGDTIGIHQNDKGEYVLHSQAIAVIAAKDAEIERINTDIASYILSAEDQDKRRKNLEAKLAQIEKPSPYIDRFTDDDGDTTSIVTMAIAPVASDADLREKLSDPTAILINMMRGEIAKPEFDSLQRIYPEIADLRSENERLREALKRLVRNGQKQGWNDNYENDMNLARAALNPSEPKP